MDDKYFDLPDESDEPDEPSKYKPKSILTNFSDADLKRHYQKVKGELESGEMQMDTEFWFRGRRWKNRLHTDPVTPADVIKEYRRRKEDKAKGLLEY